MSGSVSRVAGVAGSFTYTLPQVPVQAPLMSIFSDAARTQTVVGQVALAPTSNPAAFMAVFPASLPAGTYYPQFLNLLTAGQPLAVDSTCTLILTSAAGSVGSASLAVPADVQTGALQYLFRQDNDDALTVASELAAASRAVEGMVTGRLLPFVTTSDIRTVRDPNQGVVGSNWQGGGFIREIRLGWLGERPVFRPELWAGSVTGLLVKDPTSTTATAAVDPSQVDFTPATGKVRFPLPQFTFVPLASFSNIVAMRASVTYTGGYPAGQVPEDLVKATTFKAASERLLALGDDESQSRSAALEAEVTSLLKPWNTEQSEFVL